MYQNRPRRFRRRSNGRNHQRDNGDMKTRHSSNSFSDNQMRNRFRTPQSAEKLFEKYNAMAKEALSSGDKTLSENYFQHADHFVRVLNEKEINRASKIQERNLDEPKKLNEVFRTSLVLELIWEDTINYIVNQGTEETFKKISVLNLFKKYFSKYKRSQFRSFCREGLCRPFFPLRFYFLRFYKR